MAEPEGEDDWMNILREEFYFEPRVIDYGGYIRWYGERFTSPEMLHHMEATVYIRDNGEELYVYKLDSDERKGVEKIEAVFTLICKVKKKSKGYRYGRKIV